VAWGSEIGDTTLTIRKLMFVSLTPIQVHLLADRSGHGLPFFNDGLA
jgi:hypothetical protein